MTLLKDNLNESTTFATSNWALSNKLLFRFFFIYLVLQMSGVWLTIIPYSYYITQYYFKLTDLLVIVANDSFFHVKKVLAAPAGSDTSYAWANVWLYISLALIGCVVWSFLDRKRSNYQRLNYWLCLFVRYYIALTAFNYGIIKIFSLQMPFPSQSQLATPLGDFLPMRLCWMFMGYSTPYQLFTGIMETFVGFLLLYRKTTTLGVFLALFVFINVMMLNISYDIPVKLFSMNVVVACLYLLVNEYDRMMCFFVLDKHANTNKIYHYAYSKKWMRILRIGLKIVFFILIVASQFYDSWDRYKTIVNQPETKPIKSGIYDVAVYAVNKDTLLPLLTDSLRWQNVIFDGNGIGSIKTADTSFRQRYQRGYFAFSTDTIKQIINFTKWQTDSTMYNGVILSMHYKLIDNNTIQLWGKEKNDSLYVLLKRSNRHFQLAEKQFHWLSEYNR